MKKFTKKQYDGYMSVVFDRIDSNKGYTPNNICLVTSSVNSMKNSLTHEEFIYLIKLIASNF